MTDDSPFAPPKSTLLDKTNLQISQRGRYVILDPQTKWPARCFKCNQATELTKSLTVSYFNPWIYLSIIITPLVTILLALIFRKRYVIDLPVCRMHAKRRLMFVIFQWVLLLLIVGSFTISVLTGWEEFLTIGIVLTVILLISAIAFGRQLFAAKMKKQQLWLTGTGRRFRQSLAEYSA